MYLYIYIYRESSNLRYFNKIYKHRNVALHNKQQTNNGNMYIKRDWFSVQFDDAVQFDDTIQVEG